MNLQKPQHFQNGHTKPKPESVGFTTILEWFECAVIVGFVGGCILSVGAPIVKYPLQNKSLQAVQHTTLPRLLWSLG